MNKLFALVTLVLGLLLAGPVLATDTWTDCHGAATAAVGPGYPIACAALTGSNPDTTILSVQPCEHFDVLYNSDDTGVEADIEVVIMNCLTNVVSANSCSAIDGITLSGSGANAAIYGAGGLWIWVDGTGVNDGETPAVVVICRM